MCNSLHPLIEHRQETKSLRCPLWVISGHLQCKKACPLYPRKRTCAVHRDVRCAKADIATHSIRLPVLCELFCAADYLDSYDPSPLIVDRFGFLSKYLNVRR